MLIAKSIFVVTTLILAGIIFDRVYVGWRDKAAYPPSNPLPDRFPTLTAQAEKFLKLYLHEWQVTIETQMHFNELILRFRSVTLTAVGTLVGAAIAIKKLTALGSEDYYFFLVVIGSIWIAAFVIDVLYYNRLLLGAVNQAAKFDNSPFSRSIGSFGLTDIIGKHVKPGTSKFLVTLYYLLPVIFTVAFILIFN